MNQTTIEKISSRPTWAEVNLSNIKYNIDKIKECLQEGTKILAVVKANAYGHGMLEVSNAISSMVDHFGVATVDEAIFLRKNKIKLPILVMSAILADEAASVIDYDLTATVFSIDLAKRLDQEAGKRNKKACIHIKVDTGMGRIGIWHEEFCEFLNNIKDLEDLIIEGIYTHFPSAEEDDDFTSKQIDIFNNILMQAESTGLGIPLKHASNSAAIVKFKSAHFNLTRPGLMIYGVYPDTRLRSIIKLKPALSLKSKLTYIKKVKKGRSISYGRTFTASKDTIIGTIPIGYADGYPHALSNKAKVLINGEFVSVIGRICMDQMMVELDTLPNAKIGDEVVLIGTQGSNSIEVEEIASLIDTISYEILCSISPRVSRVFVNS